MPRRPITAGSVVHTRNREREPLAIIGIGCRLPGGIDSPASFWEALLKGVDAICDVPADRWDHTRFHDPNPRKTGGIRNAKGGFIEGIDQFDAEFFGYFPTEAQRIDPQQRILLEVTHEAMEDAGLRRDQLDGSRTAVFTGSFMYDYLCMQSASEQRDEINPYVAMGTSVSPLANRISYNFNLKGPSVALDTACSSSLVALHLACCSVWGGEADLAIAGGVNVILRPESSILLSRAGFLNPDQSCKAFDAAANGYVRGEGAGVVILKPLRKALTDGDLVYACVRGSAVNQDGFLPEGFTVPNVFSQIALLNKVYADAEIDPLSVNYVEAHGTGTPVGDPIETLALGAVMGRAREAGHHCLIGSVKTNLGHLEGASGITGFIKAALTAHHGIAPPNLHFHDPNPEIDWDNLNLTVPVRPTTLNSADRPCLVGVNSFGAGGTNAHVILEAVQPAGLCQHHADCRVSIAETMDPVVYVLSAVHREALPRLALRHADFLGTTRHSLKDIAWSAFARRSRYEHLLAVVGRTHREVAEALRSFADGQIDPAILVTRVTRRKEPKLAFVFSGQGGQWARMGLQLMQHEPVFRESMEDIDRRFQELAGWSLLAEIRSGEDVSRIHDTVVVQPAVMAVQISLFKLYEHYGIQPAAVAGHSIGEVAAAFAAGALTIDQAVRVIYHRSQCQNKAAGQGGMLAVGLSPEDARTLTAAWPGRVSIGAINGPKMLTLSGDTEPLQQISASLEAQGVFCREVRVEVAYHSHHMDAIRTDMLGALSDSDVQGIGTTTPLYSTVTGRREPGTHLNPEYWFQNVRQPVLFTDAMTAMLRNGCDTFVEIGPHPVLVSGGQALIKERNGAAMMAPVMTRREPEVTVFLQSLARLAARGLCPHDKALFGAGRRYVKLPQNPWLHSRYWFETPAAARVRHGAFEHPFLKRQTQLVTEDGPAVWEAALDVQKFPFLRDHQVDGEIVFPASGHIELAWAVAAEQFRHEAFFLENLQFDSPLVLPDSSRYPPEVRLEIVSGEGDYRICSRPADDSSDAPWMKHSSGRINTVHDRFAESTVSLHDLQQQFLHDDDAVPVEQFYETISAAGLAYGEDFRCIDQLWHRDHEMLAHLSLPPELNLEAARASVHPTILDACLHTIFADVHRHGDPHRIFLPWRIGRVRFHRRPSGSLWAFVRSTSNDEQYLVSDTLIFDESGDLVAEVQGLVCKRLASGNSRDTDLLYNGCFEYRWKPAPRQPDSDRRIFDYHTALVIVPTAPAAASTDSAAASRLVELLQKEGLQTQILRVSSPESYDRLLADIMLDRRTLIVFAAGCSEARSEWQGLSMCPEAASLLGLSQTLHKREAVTRLCLFTCRAAGVEGDQTLDLRQAVLHGMARVINNECPQLPVTVIDLSGTEFPDLDNLCHELLHSRLDQDESEIALRGHHRFVRQLIPLDRDAAEAAATSEEPGCGGSYQAQVSVPGALDQIIFRRTPLNAVGPGEVEIAVRAAALNFKDIMNAMGLLPDKAVSGGLACDRLGLEVAGRVLRTGAGVTHVQQGDEVMARVADGFSGCVIAPAHCVVRRPARLTAQQAAAVPVVYITAWYALHHLAQMAPGETVLLHSAAGGVGGAAIQLAQLAGVSVIATAGTKEKREFLRQQGVRHVFDSRSLDFYNQVMEVTAGRGVDVVLNSLTGRFITQSLKCLAPFGRFIEIGKSDIYRNSKLGMERLGENISLFVVDVDRLAVQKPALHHRVLTEVATLFERGELKPHEITEFPISRLQEAMKFMTRAAYGGKIVLNMEQDRVSALPPEHAAFCPDRSFLISGGASGFGLKIAEWLGKRGARHLILLSRSGPRSASDEAAIADMRSRGIEVRLAQADITDPAAVRHVVAQIQADMPALAGIIHGAAVLEDASLPTMDMARFERVFNPKAQGAWNLHEVTTTAGINLDFFVMLSSISSVLGLVGQLNYAAANFFQDSLAEFRRQQGLPGTSVNLGVLGQYAGMSNAENDVQDIIGLLESQGMLTMPLADVLGKLEAVLVQQPVQRMASRFDWGRFRTAYPHLVRDSRFMDLMSDTALARGQRSKGGGLRSALAEMESAEQRQHLEQQLTLKLAQILDAAPEKLDVSASIDALGLDSLMLTDLQIWIMRMLDVNLPLIKLLKGPSIQSLTADLLNQMLDTDGIAVGVTDAATDSSADFTLADVEGIQVLSPWLIRGCGSVTAPVRLICFHSMGVGASLFTTFLLNPPEHYDILAVQTPGRENRAAEPVAESVSALVDAIVPEILPLFDRPVVIWGHSYGGIVAWEVISRLRDERKLAPGHFVVSGTLPPHMVTSLQKRDTLLKAMVDENTPEYLISLSRYVDDPDFIKSILPLMRRDYPLLKSYRFRQNEAAGCPITAFAAGRDDMVYVDEIREWGRHTTAEFELVEVDGDHWFLNRNRELITTRLRAIAAGILGKINEKVVPLGRGVLQQ